MMLLSVALFALFAALAWTPLPIPLAWWPLRMLLLTGEGTFGGKLDIDCKEKGGKRKKGEEEEGMLAFALYNDKV